MHLIYDRFNKLLNLSKTDLLLIQNLLSPEEKRKETCDIFLDSFVIEDADYETQGLLPFFLKRNSRVDFDPRVRVRINGIHRYVMCKNSINLVGVLSIIKAFNQADIPIMMMKGMALGHYYYKGLALRAMEDIDIAVPRDRFAEALRIAMQHGFRGNYLIHSADLKNEAKAAIDLHYHIFKESYANEDREDVLWQRAEKVDFYGVDVYLMCAEDLLIGTLLNEFYDIIAPIEKLSSQKKWMVDITVILEQKPDFDLALFIQGCYHFRVMPQIVCMLRSYQNIFSDKFGDYDINDIISRLEDEKEYNEARIELFERIWLCYENQPLFNIKKKYLQFKYFSNSPALSCGFDINNYMKYIYRKHHADNFYQYFKSTMHRAFKNLKKKNLSGGSAR